MDNFRIPKKINRHVLKAINYLSSTGLVSTKSITNQVAYQMRNGVPVPSLEHVIMMSLSNMTSLSLLRCVNGQFGINRVLDYSCSSTSSLQSAELSSMVSSMELLSPHEVDVPPEPIPPMKSYKVPKREEPDERDLDPTSRANRFSDLSISGDEIERVRKRFRVKRCFSRYGGPVLLPKKYEHSPDYVEEDHVDCEKRLPCFKQRHAVTDHDDGKQIAVKSTVLIRPIQYSRTMCTACEQRLRSKYTQTSNIKALEGREDAVTKKRSVHHVKIEDDASGDMTPVAVEKVGLSIFNAEEGGETHDFQLGSALSID